MSKRASVWMPPHNDSRGPREVRMCDGVEVAGLYYLAPSNITAASWFAYASTAYGATLKTGNGPTVDDCRQAADDWMLKYGWVLK